MSKMETLAGRAVHVYLPNRVFNLEQVQKITAILMAELGHPGCYSGYDLRFLHEDDFRVNPGTLNVSPVGFGG